MLTFIKVFCAFLAIAMGSIGIAVLLDTQQVESATIEHWGFAFGSLIFLGWGFMVLILTVSHR